MIHAYYNILTEKERAFVDQMFAREVFNKGKHELGYPLIGDDSVEEAVEAVSKWLVESAKYAGFERHAVGIRLTELELQDCRHRMLNNDELLWHISKRRV